MSLAFNQTLESIKNLKIPTLLGVGLIVIGIVAGVFLTLQEQNLNTQAGPDTTPKNITISNIEDENITISWTTNTATVGSVRYGTVNPEAFTAVDIRDQTSAISRKIHYVTLKNLTPQTTYKYKVVSNNKTSANVSQFTTAAVSNKQNGFKPVIGAVQNGNQPLQEGVVYLNIPGATTQSALIGHTGGFIIPIGKIRKDDLSDIFFPTEKIFSQLKVISAKGDATASIRLENSEELIGILKVGENIDLTVIDPKKILERFDLNNDTVINTSDYGIVLNNLGSSPKNLKADLNKDGVIDQKDINLIIKQINSN